jgi:hypothetical protein
MLLVGLILMSFCYHNDIYNWHCYFPRVDLEPGMIAQDNLNIVRRMIHHAVGSCK